MKKNELLEIIDALTEKMEDKNISSLKIKTEGLEVELNKNCGTFAPQVIAPQTSVVVEKTPVVDEKVTAGNVVKAPIIGTFYSAPSPNDKPFVTVGQNVKVGDVLFIIESMKVMNEVKSEFAGTISIINAKDGETVEYDQPIMVID